MTIDTEAFAGAVREHCDSYIKTPRDRRIKAIASGICKANGMDPEQIVVGVPYGALQMGINGTAVLSYPQPSWMACWREAESALDELEKLLEREKEEIDSIFEGRQ